MKLKVKRYAWSEVNTTEKGKSLQGEKVRMKSHFKAMWIENLMLVYDLQIIALLLTLNKLE